MYYMPEPSVEYYIRLSELSNWALHQMHVTLDQLYRVLHQLAGTFQCLTEFSRT